MRKIAGERPWIAVIGDMVESRALSARDRAAAQHEFARLISLLNSRFRRSIASRFVVTLGDEFQALLSGTHIIPDIVWTIESEYHEREVRLGFGLGALHTPMQPVALNIDGPVLHHARSAIAVARKRRILGGVFDGFGIHDTVLNGFAMLLRHSRQQMTERQRTVIAHLREGLPQTQIAKELEITKQAVSDHAIAAGWEAYKAAEAGWRISLGMATEFRA
ncbi:MAG TPA: SatD family protein [Thermoanaerobaculia bacterium]|nr:SatD family protein [Thermoanaerobaculia bacterium]